MVSVVVVESVTSVDVELVNSVDVELVNSVDVELVYSVDVGDRPSHEVLVPLQLHDLLIAGIIRIVRAVFHSQRERAALGTILRSRWADKNRTARPDCTDCTDGRREDSTSVLPGTHLSTDPPQ